MLLDAMAGCVFPAMAKCELQWYKLRLSSLAESRVKPEMQPQISVGISYSPIFLGRQTFKAISIKVENVIETLKDAIKIAINVCVKRALRITKPVNITDDVVSIRYRFIESYLFSFSKIFGRTIGKISFFKCMKMVWVCLTQSLLNFLLPDLPSSTGQSSITGIQEHSSGMKAESAFGAMLSIFGGVGPGASSSLTPGANFDDEKESQRRGKYPTNEQFLLVKGFIDYLYEDFKEGGKGISASWLDAHCGSELKYVIEHFSSSVDELQAEYGSLAMQVIIAQDKIRRRRANKAEGDSDSILEISAFGVEVGRKRERLTNIKALLVQRRDDPKTSPSESRQAADYLQTDLVAQVETE